MEPLVMGFAVRRLNHQVGRGDMNAERFYAEPPPKKGEK